MRSQWRDQEAVRAAVMEPESFMIGRPLSRDDVLDAAEALEKLERFDFSVWSAEAVAAAGPVRPKRR